MCGLKIHELICGISLRLVLGSLQWIILCNGILTLQLPKGVIDIDLADEIEVNIGMQQTTEIKTLTKGAICEIKL